MGEKQTNKQKMHFICYEYKHDKNISMVKVVWLKKKNNNTTNKPNPNQQQMKLKQQSTYVIVSFAKPKQPLAWEQNLGSWFINCYS